MELVNTRSTLSDGCKARENNNNNNNNNNQEIMTLRNYRKLPYWALHTYFGKC
jgi:hypothetical protein